MDALFWWTGFVAWIFVAGFLVVLLWHFAAGAARTASWARWHITMCRRHKVTIYWHKYPEKMLRLWLDLTTTEPGSMTWSATYGAWNGYGDWVVYPNGVAESAPNVGIEPPERSARMTG